MRSTSQSKSCAKTALVKASRFFSALDTVSVCAAAAARGAGKIYVGYTPVGVWVGGVIGAGGGYLTHLSDLVACHRTE